MQHPDKKTSPAPGLKPGAQCAQLRPFRMLTLLWLTGACVSLYSHSIDEGYYYFSWLAWGLRRCLHISGCFTTRSTDAEAFSESSRHPLLFLRMVSKPTTNPDIGATQSLPATFCQRRAFLVHCLPVTSGDDSMYTRLGAVAFTVLQCDLIHPYADYSTHCYRSASQPSSQEHH